MKTEEIKIKYPSGFEHAVHMTKEEIEQHIRLMAALKMFELGKIPSDKAAELAGMSSTGETHFFSNLLEYPMC